MNNIPTAEEFLEKIKNKSTHYADQDYDEDRLIKALKDFAELHVQAALKAASEKALLKIDGITETANGQHYTVCDGNHYTETEIDIDTSSILNSYPLNNIQ